MLAASTKTNVWLTVLAAALGFLVDAYDLLLFNALRVPSLSSLGLDADAITRVGLHLLNIQLVGMLIGGFVWGMLGDKYGRDRVLFGSIVIYSLATLANAFVQDLMAYSLCRFIGGFGLAGELGAGVTLVSELLPKEKRGYGTTLVAACGVLGGILAGVFGDLLAWRTAYLVGGLMGLSLLVLRFCVRDSSIFAATRGKVAQAFRGKISRLFTEPKLRARFAYCIGLGLPMWVVIGFLISLAPEMSKELNVRGLVTAGKTMIFFNAGVCIGEIASSLLSQWLRSRKRSAYSLLVIMTISALVYLNAHKVSNDVFFVTCFCLGIGAGYWAVLVTLSAEQFGTDLRATATTTIPVIVRSFVLLWTALLSCVEPLLGLINALLLMFGAVMLVAFYSLYKLDETFARDLDFVE